MTTGDTLSGRAVVVTGAGGGLGRAHALQCASLGAHVVVNDVDAEAAEATVAAVRAGGGEGVAVVSPVDTEAGAGAIVEAAVGAYGRVDAVVNNAGFLRDRSLAKLTPEMWDAVVAVHLRGGYLVTRAAWPHLRASGSGRVVMVTSHAGLVGNHGQANYAAAKMGLVGLANVLAIEGAAHGVGVNVVAPLARTRQSEGVWPEGALRRLDPAYVSALVAHLCSAACTTSGMVFGVAGGTYVRHLLCDAGRVSFDHVPGVEEIAAAWTRLTDAGPRGATTVDSVMAMILGTTAGEG